MIVARKPVPVDEEQDEDEFKRFEELTRRLVKVPKGEVDELRDAEKNGNGKS